MNVFLSPFQSETLYMSNNEIFNSKTITAALQTPWLNKREREKMRERESSGGRAGENKAVNLSKTILIIIF